MVRRVRLGGVGLAAVLVACGGSRPASDPPSPTPPAASETTAPAGATGPSGAAPVATAYNNAPEISKSPGAKGGVVVLWPRIPAGAKGAASSALAARLQQRIREVVLRAMPGRAVDVRPEPERACPRPGGCEATAVGSLLLIEGKACAVVALVSAPGPTSQKLVPWAGQMQVSATTAPFREPPEALVKVDDFVPCDALVEALSAHDADVVTAVQAAAR